MLSLMSLGFNFLRLGVSAYGGLAMIGHIKEEVVDRRGWLNPSDFLDGVALAQIIPGATVVQLVAFIGYRLRGLPGAVISSLAFFSPAMILMLILSWSYFRFGEVTLVKVVFQGLGAVVVALILRAVINMGQAAIRGFKELGLALLAGVALFLKVHFLLVLLGCGLLYLGMEMLPRRFRPGGQKP